MDNLSKILRIKNKEIDDLNNLLTSIYLICSQNRDYQSFCVINEIKKVAKKYNGELFNKITHENKF
jgi:hypothetical protein